MPNIKPRRRMADLWAKGREVRFGEDGAAVYQHTRNRETREVTRNLTTVYNLDREEVPLADAEWKDHEDDIVIWVQPPSPNQREQALREAQAMRGMTMLNARKKVETSEYVSAEAFVSEMGRDTLIEYVLANGEGDRRSEAQRNVLMREEWKDFGTLQDAMRKWDEAGNPETDEWQPLVDRDIEFGKQVDAETEQLREAARESLSLLSTDDLEKRGKEKRIDLLGNQAFMATFEREMLWAACRDSDNHDVQYWSNVAEMMSEDEYGLDVLADVYGDYIQDGREAKNARRAAPGSASSEPPAKPETSEASTPPEPTE